MNKKELAAYLARRSGLAASVCEALLTESVAGILETLARGENVRIDGLGTFGMGAPDDSGRRLRFEPADEALQVLKRGFERVSKTEVLTGGPEARAEAEDVQPVSPEEAANELEALFNTDVDHSPHPYRDSGSAPAVAAKAESPAAAPELKPANAESADDESPTALSSFARDVLELGAEELARGLGLAASTSPVGQGRRLTFPVQINPQAKEHSQRLWRPVDGDERRSFKDLTLKNFFLSLGSVVREKATREPLIVFDVEEERTAEGERYIIKLLRVAGTQPPPPGGAGPSTAHRFKYMSVDFDWNRHEPLMVIDERVGPRVHAFDVGTWRDANRHQRAEVILATEYETYISRRSGLYKSS
ncbi:MAG: HU family DNA-binding protein [Planctomycetes bacterium]|nr:HU family DNA-binding protein [Planctomycetota bacterium]